MLHSRCQALHALKHGRNSQILESAALQKCMQVLVRRELEEAAKVLGERIRTNDASPEVCSFLWYHRLWKPLLPLQLGHLPYMLLPVGVRALPKDLEWPCIG